MIYGGEKSEFILAASKPGFKPYSRVATSDGPGEESVKVVLEREEPQPEQAGNGHR